jgi:hypothetical protein
MRTTIDFASDVERLIKRAQAELHLGLSETVNRLVRKGAAVADKSDEPYVNQATDCGGLLVDLSHMGRVYDIVDGLG